MKKVTDKLVVFPVVYCDFHAKQSEIMYIPKFIVDKVPGLYYAEHVCLTEDQLDSVKTEAYAGRKDFGTHYHYIRCSEDGIINLGTSVGTVTKDSKVFVSKKCNMPRYKLRDFLSTGSGSIVRSMDKADVVVLPESGFSSQMTSKMVSVMSRSIFLDFVKEQLKLITEFTPEELERLTFLKTVIEQIKSVETEYFFISLSFANQAKLYETLKISVELARSTPKLNNLEAAGKLNSGCPAVLSEESLAFITDIVKHNCVLQNDVLNILGATEITEESYNSICEMLDTYEISNHNLAVSIMINCNFEASIYYLLRIFDQYEYKIKRCDLRTTVGYKSLKDFVGDGAWRLNPDIMYETFQKYGQFNTKNIALLKEYAVEFMNRAVKHSMTNFVIDNIVVKDDPAILAEIEPLEIKEYAADLEG